MDPPTTSSSTNSAATSRQNAATARTQQYHREKSATNSSTQKTTKHRRNRQNLNKQSQKSFHNSRNSAKIIKGEIHNVLTVMRSDPRYYATSSEDDVSSGKRVQSRFQFEERQQFVGFGRLWRSSSGGWENFYQGNLKNWKEFRGEGDSSGFLSSHPILQGLRNLYDMLSAIEVDGIGGPVNSLSLKNETPPLHAVAFIAPFAAAVCSRDVDAKTTGAALSALHKFIVYGFIGGHHNSGEFSGDTTYDALFISSEGTLESIAVVAQCIRNCAFEGSWTSNKGNSSRARVPSVAKYVISFGGNSSGDSTSSADPQTNDGDASIENLPSFLTHPPRLLSAKDARRNDRSPDRKTKHDHREVLSSPLSLCSAEDENVVLKLLSLSVQVLRCPAGRNDLSQADIVGVFDTCLHVAIAAGAAKLSLLRSAAADALSHCVIVVFGTSGRRKTRTTTGKYVTDVGAVDASDSDDDWGDRDPTAESTRSGYSSEQEEPAGGVQEKDGMTTKIPSSADCSHIMEEPALVAIMHRLAALADPLRQDNGICILALTLLNIALETMSDVDALSVQYPRLLSVMQNDLCRNLLRLSTSQDLNIFGLTLRVIFNLFNGIKDHLKVQLEVFITSVHLRILSSSISPQSKERIWSSSPEQRELALESLLEFCRENMLMTDIYLNYDCDIKCTNLFETICTTLAGVASPVCGDPVKASNNEKDYDDETSKDEDSEMDVLSRPRLNILNRLALEGIVAVIDSISRRCLSSNPLAMLHRLDDTEANSVDHQNYNSFHSPPVSGNLSTNSQESINASDLVSDFLEYDLCSVSLSNDAHATTSKHINPLHRTDSEISEIEIEWLSKARHHKLHKRRLDKAASHFNESSRDKEWIQAAEHLGVLSTPATPSSVASFLFNTPKLDKVKIGLYLSKGPKDKYPFISQVLTEFCKLFSFEGLSFSEALRMFLSTFRLPGEAQCIDRLMESFASRLFEVELLGNRQEQNQIVEKTMLEPPRDNSDCGSVSKSVRAGALDPPALTHQPLLPFKTADAAYILSFSTIMLNTDLHNPNMKDERRMTLEQFIRNNRGINDGADLPVEFLTSLYQDIKNDEIKMKSDLDDVNLQEGMGNVDSDVQFDGFLSKASNVATPFFTAANSAREITTAGIHERDMYLSISSAAVRAMAGVFVESWDDALVIKALDGLNNALQICLYFNLYDQFNEILSLLLGYAHDYVTSVTALLHSETLNDKDFSSEDFPPISKYFLAKLESGQCKNSVVHFDHEDVVGSAAHRGLMSLDCAFMLCKNNLTAINESWQDLLDVIFALRELDVLPARIAEFDDFADSQGNPLPPSKFSISSQHKVREYNQSIASMSNVASGDGFWKSLLGFGSKSVTRDADNTDKIEAGVTKTFELLESLKKIADHAQLDQIIMKHPNNIIAKRVLSNMIDCLLPAEIDDPLFEHNSVFALELAARLLISNNSYATELFPIFLSKFEEILAPQTPGSEDSLLVLKFPYLVERIVVTIMRACIHLYDIAELRIHLQKSLKLIEDLPSSFTRNICDRLGCGLAIVLRGCFYLFESSDEWSTIRTLLDIAAQDKSGRGFVFDGISSVIDYALPSPDGDDDEGAENNYDSMLSHDGAEALTTLLLNFLHGSYENDLTYKIPSMMCMKKVYGCLKGARTLNNASHDHMRLIDWEKMVTTIYNDVCLSDDGVVAKNGFESLKRVLLSTNVESIPEENWFILLNMVSTRPPSIALLEARTSSLGFIERLFLMLMPFLSQKKANWIKLEEFTITMASLARQNLRAGRATELFETTVHTLTNIANVMSMTGYVDGEGVNFCEWVSETLLDELERVGACGGVRAMIVAAHAQNKPN
ncbi:hypothetical protein ACHAXS_005280 [Conticribra weissflogii]